MNKTTGIYLLEPRPASQILIYSFARRLRLTVDDAVLLGAQLALGPRPHRLSIVREKTRPSAA